MNYKIEFLIDFFKIFFFDEHLNVNFDINFCI